MKRRLRKHRGWVAVLAFGLLFLVAFLGYRALYAAGTAQELQYVTQAAEKGTLIVSVSGTGNAALGSSHDVYPAVSGVVRGLGVKVGDTVTEGQVLFTLENEQLDMTVISAQASYDQARASVLNAEANVYQAEQSLDQLEDAPDNLSASVATTSRPSTTLPPPALTSTTFAIFPPTGTTSTSGPPTGTTSTTSTSSTEPPRATEPPSTTEPPRTTEPPSTTEPTPTTSKAVSPPAPGSVFALSASTSGDTSGSGGATIVQALSAEVSATDVTVAEKKLAAAELSLSAAQANLQTARYNLEQAEADAASRTITAPTDGMIISLNVAEGVAFGSTSASGVNTAAQGGGSTSSAAASAAIALTIVDPHSISVMVQLMEGDIPQIEVGQKATLTFDAVPDLTLAGKVSAMDLIGTNTQGVVTFNVTVAPGTYDDRVRAGMTGYASIVTDVRQDVLLVPSSAVKTSADGGSYAEVLVDDAPERRSVTLGLLGDTQIEIQSGLQEGDTVVTQTIDPNATQTQSGTGGFGMGGGFPGAGGSGR